MCKARRRKSVGTRLGERSEQCGGIEPTAQGNADRDVGKSGQQLCEALPEPVRTELASTPTPRSH